MSVRVTRKGIGKIAVEAPYNTLFVAAARRLHGRWREGKWWFQAWLQDRVREQLREIFGTDGTEPPDTVKVRVTWHQTAHVDRDGITLGGRRIATAGPNGPGVTIADGVDVESGLFFGYADGRSWSTRARAGTVALVHDFPRALVARPSCNAGTPTVEIVGAEFLTTADVAAALGVSVGWARRLVRAHPAMERRGRRLMLPAGCLTDLSPVRKRSKLILSERK